MPKRDIDDIHVSLRSAPDGVATCKLIIEQQGGIWFEPVAPGDLYGVYLEGITGLGQTAAIALADWMNKAQRLRKIQLR